MTADRMAPGDPGQRLMTADAEFVDWFVEHERIIRGMRIMAGDTACPGNNAMNESYRFFFSLLDLLVTVTGDAKLSGSFTPELIPVFVAMGIMAQRTAPDIQGPVHMFSGTPFFLPGMTSKTGILNFPGRKSDAPWRNGLLMAGETELGCLRAVLKCNVRDNILMARKAGVLRLKAKYCYFTAGLQFVTTGTARGQFFIRVKLIDILAQ
jgi:hypothetical protein